MEWNRPESIPYPNIWRKFNGLRELNGEIPKFWIQDVTEDLVEPIVESMLMDFIKEEPLCKYFKLAADPVSVAEAMELYRSMLRNKLTVVCMANDSKGNQKLAGVTCLVRLSKDVPQLEIKGQCLAKLRSLADYAYSCKDPFIHFGVDEYLRDKGIYILPEFRGQGICYEFLQSWVDICKAVGFKLVVGCFTSVVSQKVADRAKFKELNSFAYEDLEKVNPLYCLNGIQEHTKTLRLLYKVVKI